MNKSTSLVLLNGFSLASTSMKTTTNIPENVVGEAVKPTKRFPISIWPWSKNRNGIDNNR